MSTRTDVGTVDELHASAMKACGLDDFGTDDDNYREALGVLLDSYVRESGFTELGSKMSRFFVRNALVARLLSEAAWKQYPQHADVAIDRPIFVTGLPRTGRLRCIACWPPIPGTRVLNSGSRSSHSPARRAKRGRKTRFSSSSIRGSSGRTTRTRTTPDCIS
jgi:hypothetical protein